jgi:hypothetical protein
MEGLKKTSINFSEGVDVANLEPGTCPMQRRERETYVTTERSDVMPSAYCLVPSAYCLLLTGSLHRLRLLLVPSHS